MTRPRQTLTVLPIEHLTRHPDNVRDTLGDLTEMAMSIREHGIIEPLKVTEIPGRDDRYVVLDGHRRLGAAVLAQETRVPVIIRHLVDDPTEHTIVMLVTGTHRRALSPTERAKGYGALREAGLTLGDIARRTGTTVTTVANYLALLHVDEATLEQVETGELPIATVVAAVRETNQARRVAAGKPERGRPVAYFGAEHPLADTVRAACTHTPRSYGSVGCGPCWEQALRADAIGGAA